MGFLEKNRDTVLQEQIFTVAESQNPFISTILSDTTDQPAAPKGQKPKVSVSSGSAASATATRKKTVGSQFRDSLTLLMSSLNATTPHYVRCIKPNDVKSAFEFDSARAVQQLRACGVLETIRISAAGFPSRYAPHFAFWRNSVRIKRMYLECFSDGRTQISLVDTACCAILEILRRTCGQIVNALLRG